MDITSLLQGSVGQQLIDVATSKLGIENQQAKQAIAMAVPFLLKAMNKNSSTPQGAAGLAIALDNKHDGSILNNLQNIDMADGMKILGHVLGGKQPQVQNAIGKSAGIDQSAAGDLLAMAAPVLMGALGQEKRSQGISQDGIGNLIGSMLGGANENQGEMGMIEKLLDQDGDGSIADDVMNIGGKLLGSFFKK